MTAVCIGGVVICTFISATRYSIEFMVFWMIAAFLFMIFGIIAA